MYRTIEIAWFPRSSRSWATLSSARQEAGRLWGDLVERHFRIRRLNWRWPSKPRWFKWVKKKYPNLHSQSAQQIAEEFCEAVESARVLRSNGHVEARYPWRKRKYHSITYTNQAARIRNGFLLLPNGKAGTLCVKIPKKVKLPGRLMEVYLSFGSVFIVFEFADKVQQPGPTIGVDLGVNTLIAATDGNTVVLTNGKEVKATVQWRNKRLASIKSIQSSCVEGSIHYKRLQRRKYRLLDKSKYRIRDLIHKATRLVANKFPHAKAYVGKPFNDAAQKANRTQAQQISQACNAKIIHLLAYKLAGGIEVDEHYSSQTCPVCGCRHKCRRIYVCKNCGFTAPRDVVGSMNIRSIGMHGSIVSGQVPPTVIKYLRPRCRSSSGGLPGNSSFEAKREACC